MHGQLGFPHWSNAVLGGTTGYADHCPVVSVTVVPVTKSEKNGGSVHTPFCTVTGGKHMLLLFAPVLLPVPTTHVAVSPAPVHLSAPNALPHCRLAPAGCSV